MPKLKITKNTTTTKTQLPYAGTSGWSGSDTSYARAAGDDAAGVTGKRQRMVLHLLAAAEDAGLTWKELADLTGWHHGTASGALSVLHKTGHICRLSVTRSRCKVYVLPEHVGERVVERQGNRKRCPHCGGSL